MTNEEELHWFCFSYMGRCLELGRNCEASTYSGYSNKNLTLKIINANKKNAGVHDGATLVAVSYLGYMTKKEFTAD